jgi:hypothetical protein
MRSLHRFVLVIACFVVHHSHSSSPNTDGFPINAEELHDLSTFFFETNGARWKENQGWKTLLNESGVVSNPCAPYPYTWYVAMC